MKVAIYQIDFKLDKERVKFMGLETLKKHRPDPAIYRRVWSGTLEVSDLEGVYIRLQHGHGNVTPADYKAHSLSVSDVVEVIEGTPETDPGFYYCNNVGFVAVDFKPKEAII